ncbi:MAG: N-acetyl-gamma-glutamyl-phosphate reductase [Zavarzinella sp.]
MTKVAILGGSGYTAVELIKILLRHPHVQIVAITSRQDDSPPIADLHPSLLGRIDLQCVPFQPDALSAMGVECAFGCLPHGVSAECVAPLLQRGIRVVDLSADYRLRDLQIYTRWYGEHHDPANLAQAVYGLPEMHREAIRTARLVANPGCYPQTGILGLAPLVKHELLEPRGIIVNSLSGVSGAGRTPKLGTLFPECNESISAYNVGKHRHTPEIEQSLSWLAGHPVQVIFTPHLAPMDRGIFSTIYAQPKSPISEEELVALYRDYFANEPFVRVRTTLPATKDTMHSNFVDICPKVVHDQVVILVTEDNLVRGASGVAVQNMNIMFGYEETTALL